MGGPLWQYLTMPTPPSQPPCPSEVLPTYPSGVWENKRTAESISLREAYEL